jgi:hypothetical protein
MVTSFARHMSVHEDLDYQLRPQSIQQALAVVGSVQIDGLRDGLRSRIESEKGRVSKQLELLATGRERLESAIRDADAEVERLRERLNSPRRPSP